ncbi:Alpha/Beta hydrolase protein [Flammula alnicola]|nr:Alpha/Beta hydrolase protein [Flammula alnicola]
MSIVKEDHIIGGIQTHVYKGSASLAPSVVVVFLLHGRTGSADDVDPFARTLIDKARTKDQSHSLCIVTLDHRNHGGRLLDARANNTWTEVEENKRHALDMYSIQVGTAKDVSFLIDFLPAYLFPHDECKVDAWGVAGISLGGHSTWLALSQDPRIGLGIPIIGCPDYLELIKRRAETSNIPFTAPYVPSSFLEFIGLSDPASKNYASLEESNPFLGKKILVLSGEEDTLVPWAASDKFVSALEVGPRGLKRVIVQKGVGHECTDEMVEEAANFIKTSYCSDVGRSDLLCNT